MSPKEKARQGVDHFVEQIYEKTGRAYQYSTARQLAIENIDLVINKTTNEDDIKYLLEVKQELNEGYGK